MRPPHHTTPRLPLWPDDVPRSTCRRVGAGGALPERSARARARAEEQGTTVAGSIACCTHDACLPVPDPRIRTPAAACPALPCRCRTRSWSGPCLAGDRPSTLHRVVNSLLSSSNAARRPPPARDSFTTWGLRGGAVGGEAH